MKSIMLGMAILFFNSFFAQSTFLDSISSRLLNENRKIRVYLPESFNRSEHKTYPLILTLDGEYMFHSIVGSAELLLFGNEIPEVVIVGIDQNHRNKTYKKPREIDCKYDYKTGLPVEKAIAFKKFILKELIPYLETKYRIGKFRTVCGHSFTANYINYFLLEKELPFDAFIAISPYIPEPFEKKLYKALDKKTDWLFYYLSTGENDFPQHRESILKLNNSLFGRILSAKFKYKFDDFDKETHLSLVGRSMPFALRNVFSIYAPIRYKTVKYQKEILNYLLQKYNRIQKIYDIKLKIRPWDLSVASEIALKNNEWVSIKKLGDLTVSLYPDISDGYALLAQYEEKESNYQKALELYQKAYDRLRIKNIMKKISYDENIKRIKEKLRE